MKPKVVFQHPMLLCDLLNPYHICCTCYRAICRSCDFDMGPKRITGSDLDRNSYIRINDFISSATDHRCIDGNCLTEGYDF